MIVRVNVTVVVAVVVAVHVAVHVAVLVSVLVSVLVARYTKISKSSGRNTKMCVDGRIVVSVRTSSYIYGCALRCLHIYLFIIF